jgi:hypothetical protein
VVAVAAAGSKRGYAVAPDVDEVTDRPEGADLRMTGGATYVYEARFQPIHKGHVAYVGELVARCDRLIVVVVANETSEAGRSPMPAFSRLIDKDHSTERNPWPLWLRHRLVAETLRTCFPDRDITVLAGHRIDLDWALYDALLPPDRVFAVPLRDDADDAKAAAWTSLGQRVARFRVDHLPVVSGTSVRERMLAGGDLETVLEPVTLELLRDHPLACFSEP